MLAELFDPMLHPRTTSQCCTDLFNYSKGILMPTYKLLFVTILTSILIISCGPSIKVTSTGETREPKSEDYKMLVLGIN